MNTLEADKKKRGTVTTPIVILLFSQPNYFAQINLKFRCGFFFYQTALNSNRIQHLHKSNLSMFYRCNLWWCIKPCHEMEMPLTSASTCRSNIAVFWNKSPLKFNALFYIYVVQLKSGLHHHFILVPLKYFSLSISMFHLQQTNKSFFEHTNAKEEASRKKEINAKITDYESNANCAYSWHFHFHSILGIKYNIFTTMCQDIVRYASIHWHYSNESFPNDKWFFE